MEDELELNRLRTKANVLGFRPCIAGICSQLNPAMWAKNLFYSGRWDRDAKYILNGVVQGFRMVDPGAHIHGYCKQNYDLCYSVRAFDKLNKLLLPEINAGKLSVCEEKPT